MSYWLPSATSIVRNREVRFEASFELVGWCEVEFAHVGVARFVGNLLVHNQFDRASTSIPLNIAEGNGKYTSADRCRLFDNARGSALECAACLDVLVAKSLVEQTVTREGKEMLIEIVSMLVGGNPIQFS